MGNIYFDTELRMKKGSAKYHEDKVKGGRCSSSAGKPRPYARSNMLKARLYSPQLVGQTLTLTPKHPWLRFQPGRYYECSIIEVALGEIDGYQISANDIFEHFIVKTKGRT